MNTLIIAQYSNDLRDLLDEVANTASSISATIALGDVTERMIADKTRGKRFDLVIFTGHGVADGYVLSDGILSPSSIASYMRRWGADKLILNCCFSWRWVPDIQRVVSIGIVAANRDDLNDRDAWRAMEGILHGLQDGLSLQDSADPSVAHSYWGVGGEKLEGSAAMSEYNQYIHALEQELANLRLSITKKDGDTEAKIKNIERSISAVEKTVAELNVAISQIVEEMGLRRMARSPEWKINALLLGVFSFLGVATILIFGLSNGWWK